MTEMTKASWHAFYWRVRCDFYKFTRQIHNTFLDMILPVTILTIVWGYIMPVMGLPHDFGGFVMLGWIVVYSAGLPYWEFGYKMLTDLQGDRMFDYDLTLKMPSWMVYLRLATSWFLQSALHNSLTLVVAKLLLGARFNLSSLIVPKYILVYLLMNFCFGLFAAMVIFRMRVFDQFQRFWSRIVIQSLFLSGLEFPYAIVAKNLPWFSYLLLFSPYTYAYEGIRGSVFGQEGYINYWICLAALAAFAGLFLLLGFRWFRQRLDCV
jgi:hypothetical protein